MYQKLTQSGQNVACSKKTYSCTDSQRQCVHVAGNIVMSQRHLNATERASASQPRAADCSDATQNLPCVVDTRRLQWPRFLGVKSAVLLCPKIYRSWSILHERFSLQKLTPLQNALHRAVCNRRRNESVSWACHQSMDCG